MSDTDDRELNVRRDTTWTPHRPCQITIYWLSHSGNSDTFNLTNGEARDLRDKLSTYLDAIDTTGAPHV